MDKYARLQEVQIIARNNKCILIHPDTGYWLVCSADEANQFNKISENPHTISYNSPVDNNIRPLEKQYLYETFYNSNLLSKNGELAHPPTLPKNKIYPLDTVVFNVTNSCNLRCNYCYANSTVGNNMPLDVIKTTVEQAIKTTDHLYIQFSGNGEPLINWELLTNSFDYFNKLRKKGISIKISVQTNGTLIDQEKANILKEESDKIIISLDGPEEITNSNRFYPNGNGAYNDICRGIENLQKAGAFVELSATILDHQQLVPIIEFLFTKEPVGISHNFLYPHGRAVINELEMTKTAIDKIVQAYNDLFQLLMSHNKNSKKPVTHRTVRQWVTNIISEKRYSKCWRSPCGAGTQLISVDHKGNIYPCHAMTEDKRIVGNVFSTMNYGPNCLAEDLKKRELVADLIEHHVDNIPECKKCAFKRICGGPCPYESLVIHDKIIHKIPSCTIRKKIFEELIFLIAKDKKNTELLAGKA